jgi:hypothetical protein
LPVSTSRPTKCSGMWMGIGTQKACPGTRRYMHASLDIHTLPTHTAHTHTHTHTHTHAHTHTHTHTQAHTHTHTHTQHASKTCLHKPAVQWGMLHGSPAMKFMEYVFDHGCIFSYVNDFKDVAGAANVVYGSETFTDEEGATMYTGRIHCKTLVDVKKGEQILAEYGKCFWFPHDEEVFEEEDPYVVGAEADIGFMADFVEDDYEDAREEEEDSDGVEQEDNADPGKLVEDPPSQPSGKKRKRRKIADEVEEVPRPVPEQTPSKKPTKIQKKAAVIPKKAAVVTGKKTTEKKGDSSKKTAKEAATKKTPKTKPKKASNRTPGAEEEVSSSTGED